MLQVAVFPFFFCRTDWLTYGHAWKKQKSYHILRCDKLQDIRQKFGIKEKNRRGHIYIVGKTGTGKSTLIENMVISDVNDGNGLALIDPHGDLSENILNFIPKKRVKDIIYFNPGDIEYPIAFNPLESPHPDQNHLIASGLISVFKKI